MIKKVTRAGSGGRKLLGLTGGGRKRVTGPDEEEEEEGRRRFRR